MGGSGAAVFELGVNLPAMFVKSLLGEGISSVKHEIGASATFVNERMCIDDWLSGRLSTNSLHQIINSADIHFVKDNKDSCPYEELVKEIRWNNFNYKRIIKRVIHKIK